MRLTKPRPPAVRVQLRDTVTGKSKSVTVYDATLDEVLDRVKRTVERSPKSPQMASS